MPDLSEYCRELESYLCRKNGGHLVRIIGTGVRAGVRVGRTRRAADRGLSRDRSVLRAAARRRARRAASGPRRVLRGRHPRPVRRLAPGGRRRPGTGRGGAGRGRAQARADRSPRARRRAAGGQPRAPVAGVRAARRRPARPRSIGCRANRRSRAATRGRRSSTGWPSSIASSCRPRRPSSILHALAGARREAEAELAPFGSRLSPEMRAQAVEAAFERLVRDSLGLPQIRYQ